MGEKPNVPVTVGEGPEALTENSPMEEEKKHPWEMMDGESVKGYAAFRTYLALPTRQRSILRTWCQDHDREYSTKWTTHTSHYRDYANKFEWKRRALAYDDWVEAQKAAEREAERKKVLENEYANMHVRVRELNAVAIKLRALIDDDSRLWLREVKQIGYGASAEIVETERFNTHLIEQFRATLNDIASELGERVKKTDVTTGGEAIKAYIGINVDEV